MVVHDLLDEIHQGGQRLPAFARLRALRFFRRKPQRRERGARDPHRVVGQVVAAGGADELANGVADLAALEKALATADLVDNAGIGKSLLEALGLGVDAVQDGDLGGGNALVEQAEHLAGDLVRLGFFRLVGVKRRLWAGGPDALQFQAGAGRAVLSLGDDPVGQVRDLRRGAVVALQLDHRGVVVGAGEIQQVFRRGAGKRVDGLVGVAHHGEIVALAQPRVEHPLLQRGDVLVLVHDEGAVLVAELVGDRRGVFQSPGEVEQQVVEV